MLDLFASQGIVLRGGVRLSALPARRTADAASRKLGLVRGIPAAITRSIPRAAPWSAIATPTSSSRANSASRGCGCASTERAPRAGRRSRTGCSARRAAPGSSAAPGRPTSRSRSICHARGRAASPPASASSITCSSRSPSTAASRSRSNCRGDLHIDEHHTVEDCALALGAALREALGDKGGIGRYGFLLAMDEAEAQVAIDLSGRPYFVWEGRFDARAGRRPADRAGAAFLSLAGATRWAPRCTCAVRGENTHHMVESCFKGVGRALRQAIRRDGGELPIHQGHAVSAARRRHRRQRRREHRLAAVRARAARRAAEVVVGCRNASGARAA